MGGETATFRQAVTHVDMHMIMTTRSGTSLQHDEGHMKISSTD